MGDAAPPAAAGEAGEPLESARSSKWTRVAPAHVSQTRLGARENVRGRAVHQGPVRAFKRSRATPNAVLDHSCVGMGHLRE